MSKKLDNNSKLILVGSLCLSLIFILVGIFVLSFSDVLPDSVGLLNPDAKETFVLMTPEEQEREYSERTMISTFTAQNLESSAFSYLSNGNWGGAEAMMIDIYNNYQDNPDSGISSTQMAEQYILDLAIVERMIADNTTNNSSADYLSAIRNPDVMATAVLSSLPSQTLFAYNDQDSFVMPKVIDDLTAFLKVNPNTEHVAEELKFINLSKAPANRYIGYHQYQITVYENTWTMTILTNPDGTCVLHNIIQAPGSVVNENAYSVALLKELEPSLSSSELNNLVMLQFAMDLDVTTDSFTMDHSD